MEKIYINDECCEFNGIEQNHLSFNKKKGNLIKINNIFPEHKSTKFLGIPLSFLFTMDLLYIEISI